ncbi:MAG TPA: XrtA/PEP-CTERM system histidine kinase PrsK [candidate division Zixibacteria bacterium]
MVANSAISLVSTVVMLGTAVWVLAKNSRASVSRLFCLSLFCLILIQIGFFVASAFESITQINWGYYLIVFGLCFLPFSWIWFTLVFARESYEITLKRWKYALLAVFVLGIGFLAFSINKELIFLDKNIFGAMHFYFSRGGILFLIFLLISSVLVIINLENTFRFSGNNLRKQLLVPVSFITLLALATIFSVSHAMLLARIGTYPFVLVGIISVFMCISVGRYIVKSDLSIGTVYIGRRAVYSSIALILIGAYLLFIGIVAKIVQMIGGNLNIFYSIIAAFLVIVIFSVLVVSSSVKQRIKSFVDKTFYRGRFDYQKEWSELSESISAILDLDELFSRISNSLSQNLETRGIQFFLAQKDGTFLLSYPKAERAQAEIEKGDEFLEWVWLYGKPIRVEELEQQSKSLNSSFLKGGYLNSINTRVLVPLITKRKLIGVLLLGEKKDKKPYTNEELVLLEAVAHQLAIAILNAKMSEELLLSKEMESFHKLSSFVVHDLKNAISMLSMLLQNAKDNMHDPNFQKGALLTVSDAVERMRGLVTKISSPSKEMQLDISECNLSELIKKVVTGIDPLNFPRIKFNLDLNDTAMARLDESQISKVLQNLIINAVESMPPQGGVIDISVYVKDYFWCVAVSDSGVGMSREFMKDKLFKPFQSTKKKGLGIGLYQSKEIVEAHGGKIEVESAEGKGATFEIRLPIDK